MNSRIFHFHGRLVDDQPRTHVCNVLHRHQTIRLQGIARLNDVDDSVRKARHRRQFHRSIKLDDIDLHALLGVVLLRRFDKFCGDSQPSRERRLVLQKEARVSGRGRRPYVLIL